MFKTNRTVARRIVLYVGLMLPGLCFVQGCGRGEEQPKTTLVLLTRHRWRYETTQQKQIAGLLPRELARQALLLAARDELGMRTRDASLGEFPVAQSNLQKTAGGLVPKPDALTVAPGELVLLMTVDAGLDDRCQIRISKPAGDQYQEIWAKEVAFEANSRESYSSLSSELEKLSRTDFPSLLAAEGAKRDLPAQRDPAAAEDAVDVEADSKNIEGLLTNVELFSQVRGVQQAHRLCAASEDSRESLGHLVRGYAQLGLLTEGYWGAFSRVFRARSLMYAERLKHAYPDDRLSDWNTAYAHAVGGIHFRALEILAEIPAEEAGKQELPAWTQLIAHCCKFESRELAEIAESDSAYAKWARYLRYWSFFNSDEKRRLTTASLETVQDCYAAFNIYSLMACEGQLGAMHSASRGITAAMVRFCSEELAGAQGTPAKFQEAAGTPRSERNPWGGWAAAAEALQQSTEQAEPSWQVLGNLMEETAVLAASVNLLVAHGGSQEHSLEPYVEAFEPVLKNHQAFPFFQAAVFYRDPDQSKVKGIVGDLRLLDANMWQRAYMFFSWSAPNVHMESIGYFAYRSASRDFVAPQLVLALGNPRVDEKSKSMFIREMGKISPASPLALTHAMRAALDEASSVSDDQLEQWKQAASQSAAACLELARLYTARKEYDAAYDSFGRSFRLSPSTQGTYDWAYAYESAGEPEKFVPTMKKYLEVEDYGLGHSNAHAYIAQHYLRHDQADQAVPHAIEAAKSYSGRGLQVAAEAYEQAGDAEKAGIYFERLSKAYPSFSGLKWYLWLRRTGESEVSEARQLALRELGVEEMMQCDAEGWWPLTFYVMEDDQERTMRFLNNRISDVQTVYSYSHLLAATRRIGNKAMEETAYQRLAGLAESLPPDDPQTPWTRQYVAAVAEILESESADAVSVDSVDVLLEDQSASLRKVDAAYFLSQLLASKNYNELAAKYRQLAVAEHKPRSITWHLAAFDQHAADP